MNYKYTYVNRYEFKNRQEVSELNVEFEGVFSFKYDGLKSAKGMLQNNL